MVNVSLYVAQKRTDNPVQEIFNTGEETEFEQKCSKYEALDTVSFTSVPGKMAATIITFRNFLFSGHFLKKKITK